MEQLNGRFVHGDRAVTLSADFRLNLQKKLQFECGECFMSSRTRIIIFI